jgi:hypothetical protein
VSPFSCRLWKERERQRQRQKGGGREDQRLLSFACFEERGRRGERRKKTEMKRRRRREEGTSHTEWPWLCP